MYLPLLDFFRCLKYCVKQHASKSVKSFILLYLLFLKNKSEFLLLLNLIMNVHVFITRYCFIAIMHGRSGKNLFKALIYFYGQAKSMGRSILRNTVSCYQNRIPWQAFLWKHFVDSVFD